jgi:hypothetical protein
MIVMLFLLKELLQDHQLHYQRLLDHKEILLLLRLVLVVAEVVEEVGKDLLVQLV